MTAKNRPEIPEIYAFKFIRPQGATRFGSSNFKYPLPTKNKKGRKTPYTPGKEVVEKDIVICNSGFHGTYLNKITKFANNGYGDDLYLVKISGDIIFTDNKLVASHMQVIRKLDHVDLEELYNITVSKKGSKKQWVEDLVNNNPWLDDYNYIISEKGRTFKMSQNDAILPADLKKSWHMVN